MRVLLFGGTGMVGQGVLRECLLADDVEQLISIGRTPVGQQHPRLQEIVQADLFDYTAIESRLAGLDACFFCLGVSAAGLSEAQYAHLSHDLTLTAAQTLVRLNPSMTFIYVSGAGTDSSERGRSMWARVKGRTENDLQKLPFKAVYLFRPGVIQPLHGIESKTGAYRWFYRLGGPLLPLLRALMPNQILTTEIVGKAMLAAARQASGRNVVEASGIAALARA